MAVCLHTVGRTEPPHPLQAHRPIHNISTHQLLPVTYALTHKFCANSKKGPSKNYITLWGGGGGVEEENVGKKSFSPSPKRRKRVGTPPISSFPFQNQLPAKKFSTSPHILTAEKSPAENGSAAALGG